MGGEVLEKCFIQFFTARITNARAKSIRGIQQVGSFHCRFAKFLQEVQSGASRLNTEGIDERLRV